MLDMIKWLAVIRFNFIDYCTACAVTMAAYNNAFIHAIIFAAVGSLISATLEYVAKTHT